MSREDTFECSLCHAGKWGSRWSIVKGVREDLLYFDMGINADGKDQVERKRLNMHKRKINIE